MNEGVTVGASQLEFQSALKDMQRLIDDPIFAQCESQLLSGSVGDLALHRMRISQHIETAMRNSVYFKPAAQVLQVTTICTKLTTYAEQCIEASKKHLQDTNI
ncbi:hypothetical protein V7799_01135 [Rhizobium laguerreae]